MERAGNQATSVAKSIGGCMSRDTGSHTEDVLKCLPHPAPTNPPHPARAPCCGCAAAPPRGRANVEVLLALLWAQHPTCPRHKGRSSSVLCVPRARALGRGATGIHTGCGRAVHPGERTGGGEWGRGQADRQPPSPQPHPDGCTAPSRSIPGVMVGLHGPDVILEGCRVYGEGTAIASVRSLSRMQTQPPPRAPRLTLYTPPRPHSRRIGSTSRSNWSATASGPLALPGKRRTQRLSQPPAHPLSSRRLTLEAGF